MIYSPSRHTFQILFLVSFLFPQAYAQGNIDASFKAKLEQAKLVSNMDPEKAVTWFRQLHSDFPHRDDYVYEAILSLEHQFNPSVTEFFLELLDEGLSENNFRLLVWRLKKRPHTENSLRKWLIKTANAASVDLRSFSLNNLADIDLAAACAGYAKFLLDPLIAVETKRQQIRDLSDQPNLRVWLADFLVTHLNVLKLDLSHHWPQAFIIGVLTRLRNGVENTKKIEPWLQLLEKMRDGYDYYNDLVFTRSHPYRFHDQPGVHSYPVFPNALMLTLGVIEKNPQLLTAETRERLGKIIASALPDFFLTMANIGKPKPNVRVVKEFGQDKQPLTHKQIWRESLSAAPKAFIFELESVRVFIQ